MKASETQVGGGHYKDFPIQPAEFCQKNKLPFCESAVVKYVCRHRDKNGPQDIRKAKHFLDLLLEFDYPDSTDGEEPFTDFDTYQFLAEETAIYPTLGHPMVYPALGLCGEAGEVVEKVKKLCRDKDGQYSNEDRDAIRKELGDVLWYVSEVARQFDIRLSEVAIGNIEKLTKRKEQGVLGGSGDDREVVHAPKHIREAMDGAGCPKCGAGELPHPHPRTLYACGSSDYDGRPGTFTQGLACQHAIESGGAWKRKEG